MTQARTIESDQRALSEDPEITLGLLSAVERDAALTQRSAARELGIALGLVNTYLQRCISKGLIKIRRAPRARYLYYLTPQGLGEKSRLTARYLSRSLDLFRSARRDATGLLERCAAAGWRDLAVYGAGDLAEIVVLCAREWPVRVVAVVDPDAPQDRVAGVPVVRDLADAGPVGAVIFADMQASRERFEQLRARFSADRVLALPLLGMTRRAPREDAP